MIMSQEIAIVMPPARTAPSIGRDGRLTHAILDIVEREIQPFEEFLGLDSRLAPDDVQIEPGAKHLVRAADDDGANRFVVPGLRKRRQQRIDQLHAQRIDRRAIQHDLGNIARDGITNEICTHVAASAWPDAPRRP